MTIKNILLANPRGFCAGVDYALGIVEEALALSSKPVYVLKEIVHNRAIVSNMSERGAASVTSIDEVPPGSVLIFSAHGVPPEFHDYAKQRQLLVIDATCPLVRKVHLEALRFASRGYGILYIGHEGHDEALGVLAECPDSIALVEDQATARTITPPDREKLVYLTQTTLSVDETDQIVATLKERFPDLEAPPKEDICYATTNRQRAVKELARQCELILVLGSSNSSNSQRLRECAQGQGTTAYLIDSYRELDPSWLSDVRSVGITAGASAPESAVQDLVRHLSQLSPEAESREVELVQEDMYFPVPDIAAKLQDSPKPTQVATS